MTSSRILENRIETHLQQACRREGFLCWKFTSPSRTGVPDRVIITPTGTLFVELKRPGGRLRRKQEVTVAKMRRAGAQVHTIDSDEAIEDLMNHLRKKQQQHRRGLQAA